MYLMACTCSLANSFNDELANKIILIKIFQQFYPLNVFYMDWYLGTKSAIGETVIRIKKKKAEETKEKVSKEEKTHSKIEQSKPIRNIIESIYGTNDPTQNCAPTAPPILYYLDQPSVMNTPVKEKTNTKKYTPLSKCIFKGMMLENESNNPSGMLVCFYFRKHILICF